MKRLILAVMMVGMLVLPVACATMPPAHFSPDPTEMLFNEDGPAGGAPPAAID